MIEGLFNFNDQADKQRLWSQMKELRGIHEVEIKRFRQTRSTSQNAYYWSVVIPLAVKALANANGETFTAETCHKFFRRQFLSQPIVNRGTGEIMGEVDESTTKLDTGGFAEYLDKVIEWMGRYLDVEVPPPVTQ